MTIESPVQLSRSRAIMIICEASKWKGPVTFQRCGELLSALARLALEESECISVLLGLRWLTYGPPLSTKTDGVCFYFADQLDLYAKELIIHRFSTYVRFRRD